MKSALRTFILAALAIIAVLALCRAWSGQPRWGDLLNPFTGLWAVTDHDRIEDQEILLSGLKAPAAIYWDRHWVPHVAAENSNDLYRVLGYLHARLRLFQMDVQSRMGGARLSELVGRKALSLDRALIQIGMRESSRRIEKKLLANEVSRAALEPYLEGVNLWIRQLKPDRWPSEYRLLGVAPSPWTALQVAELIQLMIFRLAGRSADLDLEAHRHGLGEQAVLDLFPSQLDLRFEMPSADLMNTKRSPDHRWSFQSDFFARPEILQPLRGNGSNNWAVGPSRSQSGTSILANDTHLAFSLPNVWFEVQLLSPEMNVYGGGFAGAPSIMSGFTRGQAWAVTNGTTDVLDWYQVQLDSEKAENFHSPHGWQKIQKQIETVQIKDGSTESIELLWAGFGPVIQKKGAQGLVERWTAYEADDVMSHFLLLNRAQKMSECQSAIAEFRVPIQNFICADADNVGLFHRGWIPKRGREQGRFVENGDDPSAQWQGFFTDSEQPKKVNPSEGFVFSANQPPVSGENPAYLGWDYENSYRARRIKELLMDQRTFGAEDFKRMQLDDLDPLARDVLPLMVKVVIAKTKDQEEALDQLRNWDYHSRAESVPPTVFFKWWRGFESMVWSDQLGAAGQLIWPNDQRLQLLLENLTESPLHPDKVWVDDISTAEVETLDMMLNRSFQQALTNLKEDLGPHPGDWTWERFRPVEFRHVGRVPGLGRKVTSGGSRHALNAVQAQHGPTWRMVVELGSHPRAWTSTPGAAEGEPFSRQQGGQLRAWAKGEYKEVLFFLSLDEMNKEPDGVFWRFRPEANK